MARETQSERRLVAMTAHELRNPVAAIMGFAETLLAHWDVLDDEAKLTALRTIRRQSAQLLRLTDDLGTFSGVDDIAVAITQIEVGEVVSEALASCGPEAGSVVVRGSAGLKALADPGRVQQILVNYLTNAFHHGGAPVTVAVDECDTAIEVRVRDEGDGVSQALIARVFEPFSGAGIGLSIAQALARAQNGETWYEPNVPRGACFCLRLPRA